MSRLSIKRPDEELVLAFYELKGWDIEDKEFLKENKIVFGRFLRPARDLISLFDGDLARTKEYLGKVARLANEKCLEEWGLEYSLEKYLEITK